MLDQLRALVLADPAVFAQLAAAEGPSEAGAILRDLAEANGLESGESELLAAIRPDPLGLDRSGPQPVTGVHCPGPDWLPTGIGSDGTQLTIDWAWFGADALRAPFFEEPLRRACNRPVSRLLRWRTPLGALLDDPALDPASHIDGLVMHLSRCGSTLVAQALGTLPEAVVLSEARPLDELLTLCLSRPDIPLDTQVALIRRMIAALTGNRSEPSRLRFIKTDSWHIAALPLLRAALPDVPWIFLYREPLAIMRSQECLPGAQVMPGTVATLLGVEPEADQDDLDFIARTLAATAAAAIAAAQQPGGIYIDYAALPGALHDRILPHFGVDPGLIDPARLAPVLARDAKRPAQRFDPAAQLASQGASAGLRDAVERHLRGPTARLAELDRLTLA